MPFEEIWRLEVAAWAEADLPRSPIEELVEDLARAEEQLSGLAIAREEVIQALEESVSTDLSGDAGTRG